MYLHIHTMYACVYIYVSIYIYTATYIRTPVTQSYFYTSLELLAVEIYLLMHQCTDLSVYSYTCMYMDLQLLEFQRHNTEGMCPNIPPPLCLNPTA